MRFVDAIEGRALNAEFRGKDYATNVLTFVYDDGEPRAGDIVLCAPVVRRKRTRKERRSPTHYAHLVVHGMLHLQGFDHEHAAARGARWKRARPRSSRASASPIPTPMSSEDDKEGDKPTLLERLSALLTARARGPRGAARRSCTARSSASCSTPTRCR